MVLKNIITILDQIFPPGKAEDFDNIGLLCGDPEREISGVLICHDALENVVEEAVAKNVNMITCFHPIIFDGLKKITGKNYVEKAVLKALENKIAIYAVHTVFDNDFSGVNYGICEALGLKNRKILMPKTGALLQLGIFVPGAFTEKLKQALFSAGAGEIGFYSECSFAVGGQGTFRPIPGAAPFAGEIGSREHADEDLLYVIFEGYKEAQILRAMFAAHPYEEVAYQLLRLENKNQYEGLGMYGELENPVNEEAFLRLIKEAFNLKIIRHSARSGKEIRTVGVLGGSGASGIRAAMAKGCDAYLTGDLKYHDFFSAESRMLLCDIGHFESEQFVVQQLFDIISEKFPKFAVLKSAINTNPVNYFL